MATKVTAAQRKHAAQSLLSTYTAKQDAIRAEFATNPENRFKVIPMQVMPSLPEAIKAVMGMDSPATLKMSKEEILQTVGNIRGSFQAFNPLQFVLPVNHVAIGEAMAYNDIITQRQREQVNGRLALLKSAYTSACDVTVLAESGDDVLRVVQEFERREF